MPRILTKEDIDDFRAQIIDVATRRFAEQGYAGVTLRGLADEVGCSRSTPYRYFRSKAEIFTAVRVAAFRELGDAVDTAEKRTDGPAEQLEAVGKAYFRFALRNPDAYRLLFELAPPHPEELDDPSLEKELRRHERSMTHATRAAVEGGFLEGDPRTLAHVFWAGMHGVVALHLSGKLNHERDFRTISKQMVQTLVRGMTPSRVASD